MSNPSIPELKQTRSELDDTVTVPIRQQLPQVLIISYLYPPIDNAGTRPVVKTAKYLPQFGYRPVILTTRNYGYLSDDEDNLIFRADELLGLLKKGYRFLKMKDIPLDRQADQGLLPQGGRLERWKLAYLIPDPKIIWYMPAVRQGQNILQSRPIQCLYSISPPQTSHLVALKLKQKSGLPWVADFRDGWLFEPLISARLTSRFRYRLEARLERAVVETADWVVAVNEVMAADLAHRYPEAATKITIVPNGYDPDDFAGLQRQPGRSDKFRIVYTGSLSLSRAGTSLEGLLRALGDMHAKQWPMMKHLEIVLVGNLAEAERRAIEVAALDDYFTVVNYVPYQEALQYQCDADVLLLVVTPQAKGISTSKLFEYLVTGRPILALSGQSVAAQIVSEMKAGVVVAPDDVVGIQNAIQSFYHRWQSGQLISRVDAGINRFDRRQLTRQLAHIFNEVT